MDWFKTIWSGARAFGFVALASVIGLVVSLLTHGMGYQPQGLLDQTIWTYIVVPGITALIAMLNNWRKHKDDPAK